MASSALLAPLRPPPGAPSEAPPPETVVEDAAPDEHGATDPEAR
jgi:hypothetical protein